ncbi:hypothetical protein ACH5RR_010488 [Cinchona calisaya]|uniref:Uncharacterized protein n=1 Tax=Cinchona calisaya TaxID=153742 RepID=A0ABD3AJ25_9GENT
MGLIPKGRERVTFQKLQSKPKAIRCKWNLESHRILPSLNLLTKMNIPLMSLLQQFVSKRVVQKGHVMQKGSSWDEEIHKKTPVRRTLIVQELDSEMSSTLSNKCNVKRKYFKKTQARTTRNSARRMSVSKSKVQKVNNNDKAIP